MFKNFKFNFAKCIGKTLCILLDKGPTGGMSYPGYIFSSIAGQDSIVNLTNDLGIGSILVTGTNGKTTTTTLLIKLMLKDIFPIRYCYENNTLNSIVTSLLKDDGDLGIFEYGIRNIKFGIPATVQKLLNPIGVVYTTISQEHAQVAGV